jgi:hypothetical protein
MADELTCCPGDPPGVAHNFDCPVYLANVEAWERRRYESSPRRACGDGRPHERHLWGAVSTIGGPYDCAGVA